MNATTRLCDSINKLGGARSAGGGSKMECSEAADDMAASPSMPSGAYAIRSTNQAEPGPPVAISTLNAVKPLMI